MNDSLACGPLGSQWKSLLLPARTPGPTGVNDQGDPDQWARLGYTPGPLGLNDLADPCLASGNALGVSLAPRQGLPSAGRQYAWGGKFDRELLRAGFPKHLGKTPHFNAAAITGLETLVGLIEDDVEVVDIRWMAYMLATAFWETSHIEKVVRQSRNKKGKLVSRTVKVWSNLSPIEETNHGPAGKRYRPEVKVAENADGSATVTEQDGDVFTVASDGTWKRGNKKAERGSKDGGTAVKAYLDAQGTPHAYFGRGYVQLTWWDNYASTGAKLGLGLQLLLDPDKALDPDIAYRAMSYGMRHGAGFANGHRFSDYFSGTERNYVGARAMVNGDNEAAAIAAIARHFEDLLYEARQL